MQKFIPVNTPSLEGNEKKYLCECIDTGWISSEGPFVKKFERDCASYVDRKYGIAVANGTAALEVAVRALRLEKGSEVIVPDFTIISCVQAIVNAGLVPVPVDCELTTWNMDVSMLDKLISEKTKAIMVVHIYGLAVDMKPVLKLAEKYQLKVIEDAAEAHGLTYYGKPCGSFGDISIFSFYANKHVACGEGGMILTDNEELAERCRSLINLCFKKERRFVHDELGYNYRMGNLQAAVGVAQLERIGQTIQRKKQIGRRYRERLGDVAGILQPVERAKGCENIYWVYGLVLDGDWKFDAAFVMQKLAERGIGTRPFFYPMHLQPVFCNRGLFRDTVCHNSKKIAMNGFYIPSGAGLTDEEIEIVSEEVKKVLKR